MTNKTKYRVEHPALAQRLVSEGSSSHAVAVALSVSQSTLKKWEKRYPAFAEVMDPVRRRELRERTLSRFQAKNEKRRRGHAERERERLARLSNKPTDGVAADGVQQVSA